jgi:hypothetical protein
MATKKKPEVAVKKTVDAILATLATQQAKAMEGLAAVTNVLLEKQDELDGVIETIEEVDAELKEVYGKEKVLLSLADLEIALQEATASHKRNLASLNVQWDDKLTELRRTHQKALHEEKLRLDDEMRKRSLGQEDEDRDRARHFEEREKAVADQENEIAEMKAQFDDLDDVVKGKVDKQVAIIKGAIDSKAKIAEAERQAEITILNGKVQQQQSLIHDLGERLRAQTERADVAAARAEAIATATVNAEAGKQALEEVSTLATTMAQNKK